ncbi:hypothetical protein [Streptomyces sp. NPDC051561]
MAAIQADRMLAHNASGEAREAAKKQWDVSYGTWTAGVQAGRY